MSLDPYTVAQISHIAKTVGWIAIAVMVFAATVHNVADGRALWSAIWGGASAITLLFLAVGFAAWMDWV